MVPGHRASKMITLTDPSLMCSVPLQLEKILDVVCQPMVWGDRGEGWHTPDWWGENARLVMEAERILSRPIYLVQTRGKKNLIAPEGKRGKERLDAVERWGGMWGTRWEEDRDTKEGNGGKSVSAMGQGERQLVLNVLQQSPSREK